MAVSFIFPKTDNNFSSVFLNILIKGEQLLPFLSFAYLLLLVILLAQKIRLQPIVQEQKHILL